MGEKRISRAMWGLTPDQALDAPPSSIDKFLDSAELLVHFNQIQKELHQKLERVLGSVSCFETADVPLREAAKTLQERGAVLLKASKEFLLLYNRHLIYDLSKDQQDH